MQEQKQETQLVVLIGQVGCGKTSLFNKCCNQNQRIAAGGESVTRDVFSTHSAFGNGFKMLDTPGIGTFKDRMDHACGIARALSEGDVHQILVCVKFERLDLMKKVILDFISRKLKRFRDLITIVVTHFDLALTIEDKQKSIEEQEQLLLTRKKEIFDLIQKNNVQNVIFISLDDNGQKICEQIDQILLKNKYGRKCVLHKSEMESFFELIDETDEISDKLIQAKNDVTTNFRKSAIAIKKFIKDFDSKHELIVDIMHCLTLWAKDFAAEIIAKYEKDHMADFNELVEQSQDDVMYYIHAQLKAELVEQITDIQNLAQQKMYQNQKYDKQQLKINDFIKQCPNPECGIFWLKVDGCSGATRCGNFPDQDRDKVFSSIQSLRRFSFAFVSTKLVFKENEQYQVIINSLSKKTPDQKSLKGCNQRLVWSELPPLDDSKMKELCDTGVLDYLSKIDVSLEKKEFTLAQKIEQGLQKVKIVNC